MLTAGSQGSGAAHCAGASGPGAEGALPKGGALNSADTRRLAPPCTSVVSEPFHKHLPQLSAQAECFWSVERRQRESSSCGLPLWQLGSPDEPGELWNTVPTSQSCFQPAGSEHALGVWRLRF